MYFHEIRNKVDLALDVAKDFAQVSEIEDMSSSLDCAKGFASLINMDISKHIFTIEQVGYFNVASKHLNSAYLFIDLIQERGVSKSIELAALSAMRARRDVNAEVALIKSCFKSKNDNSISDLINSIYVPAVNFKEKQDLSVTSGKIGSCSIAYFNSQSCVCDFYLN